MTTHTFFPLACPKQQGTLLLTPCPGTLTADLQTSLADLQSAGATALITLMTAPEMANNKVEQMGELCAELGLEWFHFAIEDEGAPDDEFAASWQQAKARVHQHLDSHRAVAIHCKGGSGRTGVVAAQILLERGLAKEEAIAQVKALRPKAFAHAVQVDYIDVLAARL